MNPTADMVAEIMYWIVNMFCNWSNPITKTLVVKIFYVVLLSIVIKSIQKDDELH